MDTNRFQKDKVSFGYASKHLKRMICITISLVWVIASVYVFGIENNTETSINKTDETIWEESDKISQAEETQKKKIQDSKVDIKDSKKNEERHGAPNTYERESMESLQVIQWKEEASDVEKHLDELQKHLNKIEYNVTDKDVESLERIVEAEAPDEDMIGKILIANVVLNRVKADGFPDTPYAAIHERINGRAQFSPLDDGRYNTIVVSNSSKEAVERALEGEDYSQGALFFAARSLASKRAMSWFDTHLDRLFQHGVHEFFTYKM